MLPIELICEIPCKLVSPSHKISIGEDVLVPHLRRLPHTCYGKALFFRYWRNLFSISRASLPFTTTLRSNPSQKPAVKTSEPNDDPERRVSCSSARTISLVFARGRSNVIVMQYHPHFLRCSAANRMHVYIVDSLLGSMFTNGSGRTADVLYAEVLLCTLLINPFQHGRGRIICKHIEEGL